MFGGTAVLFAVRYHSIYADSAPLQLAAIAVSVVYLILSARFWFWGPVVGSAAATEPRMARFDFGRGTERAVTEVTDRDSRARFCEEHDTAPRSVTLTAGRETTGAIRPAPGARLISEM